MKSVNVDCHKKNADRYSWFKTLDSQACIGHMYVAETTFAFARMCQENIHKIKNAIDITYNFVYVNQ